MKKNDINGAILISNMISLDNNPIERLVKYFKKTKTSNYILLKYDKNYFNPNDIYIGLYHSILFSFPHKRLLSFTPSKMITYNYFKSLVPIKNEKIQIEEYIDGILIQLFYDNVNKKWEIASKNEVGGNEVIITNIFEKTLKEIFIESLGVVNTVEIKDLSILNDFPKEYSYSFKLRFNKERLIPNSMYDCFLIGIHMINCSMPHHVKFIPESNYENWQCIKDMDGLINFPKKYYFVNYHELEDYVKHFHDPLKIVLIDENSGIKSYIQNNEYCTKLNLKEINEFDKYLFLCLNRNFKTKEMYVNFPHHQRQLYLMKNVYETVISNLHQCYVNYFIKKISLELPSHYKEHIMFIHKNYYIASLKNKEKKYVKRSVIKDYVNKLPPNEMMHLLLQF